MNVHEIVAAVSAGRASAVETGKASPIVAAGYFAKVSAKKALWELVAMVQSAPGEHAEAIRRALSGPAAPYPPGF